MSSADFVPVTITEYNTSNAVRQLQFTIASEEIVRETQDYNVCIRKLEVPVNSRHMPINSITTPFEISIFNDIKPEDQVIPGLEFGINHFSIPGPIYSVAGFIKDVNEIIEGKASPVGLGYLSLDGDTNEIIYRYKSQYSVNHGKIQIYFDKRLQRLFPFDYDQNDLVGEKARLAIVKSFVNPTPDSVIEVKANEFTFPLFYNLKAIRVRTSLPLHPHKLFNTQYGRAEEASLLGAITYNSATMYNERDLIYIPTNFAYSSMDRVEVLRAFSLFFSYFYADGSEIPVLLDPLDYAQITLSFDRK